MKYVINKTVRVLVLSSVFLSCRGWGIQAQELLTERPDSVVNLLYRNVDKDYSTVAFSQILGESVETRGVVNNKARLTGLLPGLLLRQTSGEPGEEDVTSLIRGKRTFRSKEPVVLVDGIERPMDMLDPSEIQSITVLKDAAATARYGLRSGNGIIQVTTKRGRRAKVRVRMHARGGLQMPTTSPDLLDSYDYAVLYNEAMVNDGAKVGKYDERQLQKYLNARNGKLDNELDAYLYPNINWYDDFTRNLTWQQRYSLNLDGGNQFVRYFVSAGYTTNQGMYNVDKNANSYNTNSGRNAISVRSNIDVNVTKRFLLSLDISARQIQSNYPGNNSDANQRVFRNLYNTPPNAYPVFLPDTASSGNVMLGGTKDYPNNVYGLLNRAGYTKRYMRRVDATLTAKHDLDFITKGLRIKGFFSFDNYYDMYTKRNKNFEVYEIKKDAKGDPVYDTNGVLQYIKTGSDTQMGKGGDYAGTERNMEFQVGFDYQRTFEKDHHVYAEVKFSQRAKEQENSVNLPRRYRGGDATVSYNYGNKYLVDFVVAYQGSEQMMPKRSQRFGFFPAISAGWILSNEVFLKDNPYISFLKLRGSYGLTGWDDIGGYFMWYQQFASGTGFNFGYNSSSFGGRHESAFALNNVTWEKDRKVNVGIDTRFFNDHLQFTADYFHEYNRDIMCAPALPNIMGISFPNYPIGRVKNQGTDLSLGYSNTIGKLEYGISGVFTYAKNKVIENGEEKKAYPYLSAKGKPLSTDFGLVAIGLFKDDAEIQRSPKQTFAHETRPGDIKYKDMNNDNIIDNNDRIALGTNPDLTMQWGTQLDLKWKNFDFNILFTGQNGGDVQMNGEAMWEFHNNGTVRKHHLGRFNPQDPSSWENATYPRLSLTNKVGNQQSSSYWRVKVRQVRLKNLEIGYNVPVKWGKGFGLDKLRLYVNGFNLFVWQSTDLIDVESGNGNYVQYPLQRIINFGINVTL